MSPLQVCLEESNAEADKGAMLDCHSMTKEQVRHTCMAGPSGPRLVVRMERRCSSGGKIGSRWRSGVRIEISASLNNEDTGNESMAANLFVEGPNTMDA